MGLKTARGKNVCQRQEEYKESKGSRISSSADIESASVRLPESTRSLITAIAFLQRGTRGGENTIHIPGVLSERLVSAPEFLSCRCLAWNHAVTVGEDD